MEKGSIKNNRIELLDCLKGIMIFAVVLGHVVSNTNSNFETNFWFRQCYSWHMFCFMAVSGYIVGIRNSECNWSWLLSRARRLLLPFAIWTFIKLFSTGSLSFTAYVLALTIEPILWYLLVQFIFEAIYATSQKFKNELYVIAISGVFIFLIYLLGGKCTTLQNLILFYPFYWIGLYMGKYHESIAAKFKEFKWLSYIVWGGVIAYPFAMILYSYHDYTRLSPGIYNFLSSMQLSQGSISTAIRFWEKVGYRVYNHFIVSPLGCLFYTCVSSIICRTGFLRYLKQFLCYLGRNTIYIYILHGFFYPILNNSTGSGISIWIYAFLLILLSCIIAEIVHRLPIADSILFGAKCERVIHNT